VKPGREITFRSAIAAWTTWKWQSVQPTRALSWSSCGTMRSPGKEKARWEEWHCLQVSPGIFSVALIGRGILPASWAACICAFFWS